MNSVKIVLISISLLIFSAASAQDTLTGKRPDIVQELKDGALLIRLRTQENKIRMLEQSGYPDKARQIEKDLREYNIEVMQAFKKNYTFSLIYFFYSSSSHDVLNRNLKGIFLDDSLQADPSLELATENYYIAELNSHAGTASLEGLLLLDRELKPVNCRVYENFCWIRAVDIKHLKTRDAADYARELDRRLKAAAE